MRICIDSSVFIRGLLTEDVAIRQVLDDIGPDLVLTIPRLVALEVTRNLQRIDQVRAFYGLFQAFEYAVIVDEPVPAEMVILYGEKGLPLKADAFIGAFAEWQEVDVLLSDNRHFLRELIEPAFTVCTPDEFWEMWNV